MVELTYDVVEVGKPIGPVEQEITEDRAQEHHETIDVTNPRFTGEGTDLVEPTILGRVAMATMGSEYTGGGQIHTTLSFEFESPVKVGDTVVGEGEVSDKFIKRGYKYVEYDVGLRKDDGTNLGRCTIETLVEMDR